MVFFFVGPFPFFSALLSIFSLHDFSICCSYHLASSNWTQSLVSHIHPCFAFIDFFFFLLLLTPLPLFKEYFVCLLQYWIIFFLLFFVCFHFLPVCTLSFFFFKEYLDIFGFFHWLGLDFLWFFHFYRFTPHHRSIWLAFTDRRKYGTRTPFVFHYIHFISSKLKLKPLLDFVRSLSISLSAMAG